MIVNKRVEIRPVKEKDVNGLRTLFEKVIPDTFRREGLAMDHPDAIDEIHYKIEQLSDHLLNKEGTFYLIALDADRIVGSIWYGQTGEHICLGSNGKLADHGEIGTVFVDPDYQGQGIGKGLFESMKACLRANGYKKCALDSGYTHAQKVWKHLIGEPDYVIKDKWGEGLHHSIWEILL